MDDRYLALRLYWYGVLKKTGFMDIERVKKTGDHLIIEEATYFNRVYSPEAYKVKQDYFYQALHFFNDYDFPTDLEREVWSLHVQGASIRSTSDLVKVKPSRVRKILQILKKEMAIRRIPDDPS